MEELERLRNKKLFLSELSEAVEEMKLIKEGKLQARDAQYLINELTEEPTREPLLAMTATRYAWSLPARAKENPAGRG